MNIYEKLQECRVGLHKKDLKKTGENKFSKYMYFELGDFLPQTMEIMAKHKLFSQFKFEMEKASLLIVNTEKPDEQLLFESPSVIAELKGGNPIQNIGAAQTYMRRYLYMMALELTDADVVNQTDPDENDEEMERQKTLNRKVNDIELEAFQQAVEKTQTKVDALFKLMKYDGAPEDMTFGIWRTAMTKIDDKKSKMAKKEQVNLGL